MKYWLQDLLDTATRVSSNEQLFDAVAREARDFGFDRCSFGLQLPLPLATSQILIFDNYQPTWRAHYQAQDYLSIDPVVAHGLCSVRPLVWTDDVFAQNPMFWEDAQAHGLHTGWAQSCFNAQGVGGMLTLSRSNDALSTEELSTHSTQLTELTQVAHECFVMRMKMQQTQAFIEPLTQRECDVLLWAIEGKTAFETAELLNIKERTVNHYLGSSMQKLGASNKIAAAITAKRLGLL